MRAMCYNCHGSGQLEGVTDTSPLNFVFIWITTSTANQYRLVDAEDGCSNVAIVSVSHVHQGTKVKLKNAQYQWT